jgi:hypothetical protein
VAFVLFWAAAGLSSKADVAGQVPDSQNWSVTGVAADISGKPIESVEVVAGASERLTTKTDASGKYELGGSKAGTYVVFVKKAGYAFSELQRVTILPGMHLKLDFQLETAAAISGRVVAEDGQPVVSARVQVWAKEFLGGSPTFMCKGEATTDDAGRYKLADLTSGAYYVGVTVKQLKPREYSPAKVRNKAPRLSFGPLFYPGVESLSEATPIRLRNSEQRANVDLIARKVETFCVVAEPSFLESPSNSQDVWVLLTEETRSWQYILGNGHGNLDKRFEVCGLVPGIRYTLRVHSWGKKDRLGGFVEREIEGDRKDAAIGYLNIGQLLLQKGQIVRGKATIVDRPAHQQFPSGVSVLLYTPNPSYVNETRDVEVQSSGEFVLPNIFAYEHEFKVFGLPAGYYVERATSDRDDLLREQWKPGSGELQVVIRADGGSVEGQVLDENAQPAGEAQVILVPRDAPHQITSQQADQNGHFQFLSVVPGSCNLIALVGVPDGEAQNPDLARAYATRATQLEVAPSGRHSVTLTVVKVSN